MARFVISRICDAISVSRKISRCLAGVLFDCKSYWQLKIAEKRAYSSETLIQNLPVLTTQGNPPVATALPIAAPPVATAVAMTFFVVASGGPPVATDGEKFHVVYKILQKS